MPRAGDQECQARNMGQGGWCVKSHLSHRMPSTPSVQLVSSIRLETPGVPGFYPSTSRSAPHLLGHSNCSVRTRQHPAQAPHPLGCSDSTSPKHWAIIKPQGPQALLLATGTWLCSPAGPETPHTARAHSQLLERPALPAGWLPEGSGVGVKEIKRFRSLIIQ